MCPVAGASWPVEPSGGNLPTYLGHQVQAHLHISISQRLLPPRGGLPASRDTGHYTNVVYKYYLQIFSEEAEILLWLAGAVGEAIQREELPETSHSVRVDECCRQEPQDYYKTEYIIPTSSELQTKYSQLFFPAKWHSYVQISTSKISSKTFIVYTKDSFSEKL